MREKHGTQQPDDPAAPVFKKRFARRVTTQRPFKFVRNIESQRTAESQVVEQVGSRGLVISSPLRLGVSITDIVQQSPVPVIISCAAECDQENVKAGYRTDRVGLSSPRRSQRCHEASPSFRSRLQYPITDYKLTKFHCTSDKRHIGSQPDSNIDEEVHFVDYEQSGHNRHSVRHKGNSLGQGRPLVVGSSSASKAVNGRKSATPTTTEESTKAPNAGLAVADPESAGKRARTRKPRAPEESTKCTVPTAGAISDNVVAKITRPNASVLAMDRNRIRSQRPETNGTSHQRKRTALQDDAGQPSRRSSLTDKTAGEDDCIQMDGQGDASSQISVATDRSGCVWRQEPSSEVDSYRVNVIPPSRIANVDVIGKLCKSPANTDGKNTHKGPHMGSINTPRRKFSHVKAGLAPVSGNADKSNETGKPSGDLGKKPQSGLGKYRTRAGHQAPVLTSFDGMSSEAFEEARQPAVPDSTQTTHLGRKKRKQVSADLPSEEQDTAPGTRLGHHGSIDASRFQSLTKRGNALSSCSTSTSMLKTRGKKKVSDISIPPSTDRRKRQNNTTGGVLSSAKRKKSVHVVGSSVATVTDTTVMPHKLANKISSSAVTLVSKRQTREPEAKASASTAWLQRKSGSSRNVGEESLQQQAVSLSSVYDDQTFGEDNDSKVDTSDEKTSRTIKCARWFHTQQGLAQVPRDQGDSVTDMLAETEAAVISDLSNASGDLKRTVHKAFSFVTRQMLHMISQQTEIVGLRTDVNKLKTKVRNVSLGSRDIHQQKCQILKELQILKRDGLDADAVQVETWLNDFQKFRCKNCGTSA